MEHPGLAWDRTVKEYGCICFYCGCGVFSDSNQKSKKRLKATRDHVIPRSRAQNSRVVPACPDCNNEKAALTIEEFRILKAFRYGQISGVQFKFPGEVLSENKYESTIANSTVPWYTQFIKSVLALTSRKEIK